GRFQVT
nr:Chain C, Serine/threonine-protein Kinase Wnk4 [Homo sapiens]2V3S_D Chain D, Serine/threonine-protein Kinase Wnk4 [Homo sapiens]